MSACQTKHLTPFQYEFDIQYSTTRGGQCYIVCRQVGVSLAIPLTGGKIERFCLQTWPTRCQVAQNICQGGNFLSPGYCELFRSMFPSLSQGESGRAIVDGYFLM